MAFFLEDIQYSILNSICNGAAAKLKNFKLDAQISVLYTKRNSFIYKTLSQLMDKIVPAGIPQYLIKYHEDVVYKPFVPKIGNEPRILNISDLEYGFVLWLAACGVSFIGFLLERVWLFGGIYIRNLLGLSLLVRSFGRVGSF